MVIKEIEGKEWEIIYADKIEKAEEFLYIGRFSVDVEGVFIYTKTGRLCRKFCGVDQTGLESPDGEVFRPRGLPDKHWPIADKVISCEEFNRLMSFALDRHIFEIMSQRKRMTFTPSVDIIGVRTKGDSEHWYMVNGSHHERSEHQEIIYELLSDEDGRRFIGLIQF